ncbi:MAG: hypothetical protein JWP92_2653 [Caulobacter sp.]|nr:hypothetical protein [Caulobacter sp.]
MLQRRKLLGLGLGALGASLVAPATSWASLGSTAPRHIALSNLHTGESLEAVYFDNGSFVPDAVAALNKVLRDYRTGDVHPIDLRLFDTLSSIRDKTGSRAKFEVISGYRSPATNAQLSARSGEVAKHSLHMDGMAMDIRLSDVALDRLRNAAVDLGRGGVGYYPESRFVHVDVGRVRRWQGA